MQLGARRWCIRCNAINTIGHRHHIVAHMAGVCRRFWWPDPKQVRIRMQHNQLAMHTTQAQNATRKCIRTVHNRIFYWGAVQMNGMQSGNPITQCALYIQLSDSSNCYCMADWFRHNNNQHQTISSHMHLCSRRDIRYANCARCEFCDIYRNASDQSRDGIKTYNSNAIIQPATMRILIVDCSFRTIERVYLRVLVCLFEVNKKGEPRWGKAVYFGWLCGCIYMCCFIFYAPAPNSNEESTKTCIVTRWHLYEQKAAPRSESRVFVGLSERVFLECSMGASVRDAMVVVPPERHLCALRHIQHLIAIKISYVQLGSLSVVLRTARDELWTYAKHDTHHTKLNSSQQSYCTHKYWWKCTCEHI